MEACGAGFRVVLRQIVGMRWKRSTTLCWVVWAHCFSVFSLLTSLPAAQDTCATGLELIDQRVCSPTPQGQYECLVRDGQQLVDSLMLYGSSGRDTVIQVLPLNGTILDMPEGQVQFKQACKRPDNSDPFSSGFVTIMANTTSANELDLVIVNTEMRANITNTLSGSARLKLYNLGWVNLCELVVPMNNDGTLNYISSLDMGLFPRQHTHQQHVYDTITIYGTYVDMATQLYISLVQRTVFPKVRALVQDLVMNTPDWQAVYSEITTCLHRAISFTMPSAKVFNSTFIAVEDKDDPVLMSLREADRLLWPMFCNRTPIATTHVKAEVAPDVGPLYRASDTSEWGPALTSATRLTEEQTARGRVPVAIMLLGEASMDPTLLPGPLEVHGPMIMWGPVYNDPNNIVLTNLDWAQREEVLHLRPGAQLFVQQVAFKNMLQRPLPAVAGVHAIGGVSSVFPLAGISSEAGQDTWPTDPPLQLHSCELIVPSDDFLALMALAFVNRTSSMAACVDPAIMTRAAALQRGIYSLELSVVDPAAQAFVVNMVGWGANLTDVCIRAGTSIDNAALSACLASHDAAAGTSKGGGVPMVAVVLGSVVAGGVLLVLLVVAGVMLWHRVRGRQQSPATPSGVSTPKKGSGAHGSAPGSNASSNSLGHVCKALNIKVAAAASHSGTGSGDHHLSVHVPCSPVHHHDASKRMSMASDSTGGPSSSTTTVVSVPGSGSGVDHLHGSSSRHSRSGSALAFSSVSPCFAPCCPRSSLYQLVQQAEQLQVSRIVCSKLHAVQASQPSSAVRRPTSGASAGAGLEHAASSPAPAAAGISHGSNGLSALQQAVSNAANASDWLQAAAAAGAASADAAAAGGSSALCTVSTSTSGGSSRNSSQREREVLREVNSDSEVQPGHVHPHGAVPSSSGAALSAPSVYSDPSLMHSTHQPADSALRQVPRAQEQVTDAQVATSPAQQQQPLHSHLLLCNALNGGPGRGELGAQDYIQLIASKAGHLGNADQVVVRGVLGRGSWGTVYEGEWRGLPVAVKTMVFELPDDAVSVLAGADPTAAVPQHTRAIMEAAIAASVGHRNLVCTYKYDIKRVNVRHGNESVGGLQIEEAFERGGHAATPGHSEYKLFLIQELCGTTLAHALMQQALFDAGTGRVHEALVLHLLLDIAQGLDYLHNKNIIHGDLKPANVLLKTEASHPIGVTAKLADFGLSSHMPEGATHVSNYTSGTPFYVAPEVVQHRRTGTASDIYSFGIIMWQLYSGGVPYLQDAEGRYMANPEFGKFDPLRTPHTVYIQMLHRCLHTSPRFRPTAGQIAAVLCGLLGLNAAPAEAAPAAAALGSS